MQEIKYKKNKWINIVNPSEADLEFLKKKFVIEFQTYMKKIQC